MYVYENNETTKETMEIIKIKNAARLSILKLSERKGMLVVKLNSNGISFKKNNLYIINIFKNPLETNAHVFDKPFDILGKEYVNNEDSAPTKYINIHIIK